MKKSILALLGALICTLGISYGAQAKTIDLTQEGCPDGELIVAQSENAEIVLSGNSICRIINNGTATIKGSGAIDSGKSAPTITNNGTLTILSGNINKTAKHDSVAPIINNGTLTISGGNITADHGIQHNRGTLTMNGGKIRAWLHPAIWVNNAANVRINGGTLQFPKDWVGIHTTGSVAICGGTFIGGSRSNLAEAEETKTCPATQSKLETPKSEVKPLNVKLIEVKNDKERKVQQAVTTAVKTNVTKTTAAITKTSTTKDIHVVTALPRTTVHLTQPKTEAQEKHEVKEVTDNTVEPKEEKKADEEEKSTDLSVAIAAILIVIAAASTGIIVTRRK